MTPAPAERVTDAAIARAREIALNIIHATGGDPKRVDEAAHVIAALEAALPRLTDAPDPEMERLLRGVVTAWEALPGDQEYGPDRVERWLRYDMKPVIDDVRARLTDGRA